MKVNNQVNVLIKKKIYKLNFDFIKQDEDYNSNEDRSFQDTLIRGQIEEQII